MIPQKGISLGTIKDRCAWPENTHVHLHVANFRTC